MSIILTHTKEPIHWGIIGCGAVTEVKSGPAFYKVSGSSVGGVYRRDHSKAVDYAKRHKIEHVFESAKALINSPYIDAVYIATPPDSHKSLALQVAAAGKPCCVEKPMAPSFAECQAMIDAFKQAQQPLFVAYYRRSLPRFSKIKALLGSGAIGAIRQVHWQFCKAPNDIDLSQQYNWRTDKNIAPGGYFDDLASHGLDLLQFFFGEISNIKGIHSNQQALYSAADAVSACWTHSNGTMGSGHWNFGANTRRDSVEIVGSSGRIEFSIFQDVPVKLSNQQGEQEFHIENPLHIQQYHVENIIAHLQGDSQHPSTGQSAARTTWAMDEIFKC